VEFKKYAKVENVSFFCFLSFFPVFSTTVFHPQKKQKQASIQKQSSKAHKKIVLTCFGYFFHFFINFFPHTKADKKSKKTITYTA